MLKHTVQCVYVIEQLYLDGNEIWILMDMELVVGCFKVLCQQLEGLNKIMKMLSQVVWSPCRDVNLVFSEYETATLTTL
jgi:hypothetical protein